MKLVLAFYGTRGDVEPGLALGRELAGRGHDVIVAVPPDLADSAQAIGLNTVDYGPENAEWLEATRDFWKRFFRDFWNVGKLNRLLRESRAPGIRAWAQMSTTLAEVTDGADLLLTGMSYQEVAVNVAEYRGIPLATLLWFPVRVNGRIIPTLPAPVVRSAMRFYEWAVWQGVKKPDGEQRRELGLSPSALSAPHRILNRGCLEIQAYDEACFPGLAADWRRWNDQIPPRRPFVGTLTLESPTAADGEVMSWIAAGEPPIFFGFGSIPVESPGETLSMIAAVCTRLGERALVGAGWTDFSDGEHFDHVKVVGVVNFATIFPLCRAVVHHGGAGTTAAGLRAGVPTLVLWMADVQLIWGVAVKRLRVGASRRFSATTEDTLLSDLRTVLDPRCRVRAREVASRMTKPLSSTAVAADLVEEFALHRVG